MKTYQPLDYQGDEGVMVKLQSQVNLAAQAVLMAAQPQAEWTCSHCEESITRKEWMDPRLLREAAREQAQLAGHQQYLSGSVLSLALHELIKQGLLEHGPRDYDMQLRLVV